MKINEYIFIAVTKLRTKLKFFSYFSKKSLDKQNYNVSSES